MIWPRILNARERAIAADVFTALDRWGYAPERVGALASGARRGCMNARTMAAMIRLRVVGACARAWLQDPRYARRMLGVT